MTPWFETYLNNLEHFGFGGAVLFVLSFAVLSMLGLPLIPFAVAAGILFGMAGGLAGVVIGSTLGATAGFLCSRYLARERFARMLARHPKFAVIDRAIHREGWKIVGLLRMCPLPFGLSNYAYGLTGVSFGHYLMATIVGMLPGETVFVYLGTAGKQMLHSDAVHDSPAAKALFYLGLVAAVLVVVVLRKVVGNRLALESAPEPPLT